MKIKLFKFIANTYGEEVEYIKVKDEEEKAILFQDENKVFIIKYKDEKDLIQKLIETKLEVNFLNDFIDDNIEKTKSILG